MSEHLEPETIQIKLQLSKEFHDEIFDRKPNFLDRANYLRLLLASALDNRICLASLSAYDVGAGEEGGSKKAVSAVDSKSEQSAIETAVLTFLQHFTNPSSQTRAGFKGEGVQGENPFKGFETSSSAAKEPLTKPRKLPANLMQHEEGIEKFWSVKDGSRSNQAWELFTTELTKIQQAYGDQVITKQLKLAVIGNGNGTAWKSITLNNYERYGKTATGTETLSFDEKERQKFTALFSDEANQ